MQLSVHISCKLTSTVLRFLENNDDEVSSLLECIETPEEFLRDPSYWIKVEELEMFLSRLLERPAAQGGASCVGHDCLTTIAQSCVEFRSWGVLDSVLRMMNSPSEVFLQPERFLSYFFAPAPVLHQVERSQSGIRFILPFSCEQYPLVSRFLAASFEAIPVFMGKPAASCVWQGQELSLNWDVPQRQIFAEESVSRQLSPELAREMLKNLQPALAAQNEAAVHSRPVTSTELQSNEWVATANEGSSRLASEAAALAGHDFVAATRESMASGHWQGQLSSDYDRLRHNIARLSDYMIRAQQIITLMASAQKLSPEVREAMRRVDWALVQQQFPVTVEDCYQLFRQTRDAVSPKNSSSEKSEPKEAPHV